VSCSWAPEAWPFHSSRMDLRMWSPSLASERKHVPQAVHVKGRRGVGSWRGGKEGVVGREGGGVSMEGRGVARASSRMSVGYCWARGVDDEAGGR
jgi:hypothetical protein